jgi:hypothetical protein
MDETFRGRLQSAALGLGLTALVFGTAFAVAFF